MQSHRRFFCLAYKGTVRDDVPPFQPSEGTISVREGNEVLFSKLRVIVYLDDLLIVHCRMCESQNAYHSEAPIEGSP